MKATEIAVKKRATMRAAGIAGLVIVVLLVATVAIVAAVRGRNRPATVEPAHLVSMEQSAAAMQQAGQTMQTHGQAMLDEGRRTGDQELITHGDHWLRDGQALMQGGQWMAQNPTAAGSLVAPGEISVADRSQLDRQVQAMIHDPSKASRVDVQALRWNGMAMRGEGQNMIDHARIMAEEVELMVERHGLQGQAAADLRQAVQTMGEVGGHLMQNGQEMMDYADRIRRSMGAK